MNVPFRNSNLFRAPETWLFILAIGVRILILSQFAASHPPLPATDDMKFYADWAVRISQGQWTDGAAFYGLPGYAFCLAGIFAIFGFNQFFVGLIQIFLEALTTVLIFKIAKISLSSSQFRKGERPSPIEPAVVGLLAATGWIFYQPAQAFSTILMPTAWLVAAFWFCVWWVLMTREASWWWPWAALGVFIGLVATMVATVLFLVPLFIASIFGTVSTSSKWPIRLPRIAAAISILCGAILLGASPASLHNYFVAKDPVMLSAHSGLNFWMGNNPEATGYPKIPEGLSAGQEGLLRDSISRAEEAAGRKLKRSDVSRFWSSKANTWIREHRGDWLRLLGIKLRNFWNAFQYDDLSEINLLRDEGILPPGLNFGMVAVLGLPGMLFGCWHFPRTRWIAAGVLLHMAALLPVFITERYRLCAVPGLMIFAAILISALWNALIQHRWLASALIALSVGAAISLVTLPVRSPGLWALDPFNTGLKALRMGQLDLAQSKLERAHALVPDNAEINFALGNLWFKRNDLDRARPYYQRTLALAHRHTGALNNLARIEMDVGNWSAAESWLRRSLEINPENPKVYFMLAETGLQAGDTSAARAAIEEALRRDPEQPAFQQLRDRLENPFPPAPRDR